MKKYLFVFLFLIGCAHSQYDANISGYNFYWYKLDLGQQPGINENYFIFQGDTAVTFSWERGTDQGPGYITPWQGTVVAAWSIVNTPELWDALNNANIQRTINLSDGIYEVTITEADVNENESGKSEPIYVEIAGVYARIQINLKIE